MGSWVPGFRGSEVQGFRGLRCPLSGVRRPNGFRGSGVPRFRGSGDRCPLSGVRCPNVWRFAAIPTTVPALTSGNLNRALGSLDRASKRDAAFDAQPPRRQQAARVARMQQGTETVRQAPSGSSPASFQCRASEEITPGSGEFCGTPHRLRKETPRPSRQPVPHTTTRRSVTPHEL